MYPISIFTCPFTVLFIDLPQGPFTGRINSKIKEMPFFFPSVFKAVFFMALHLQFYVCLVVAFFLSTSNWS